MNQKIRYGLVCLYELDRNKGTFISADQIATHCRIPSAYTQKILQRLAGAGMIESLKGAGYRLVRPLSDITAFQLVETLTESDDVPSVTFVGPPADINVLFQRRVDDALKSFSLAELSPPAKPQP